MKTLAISTLIISSVTIGSLNTSGQSAQAIAIGHPAPLGGTNNSSPAISDDGKTVVWYHQERWDTRLCLAVAPFDQPPGSVKIDVLPWKGLWPAMSGDGLHVFWPSEGIVNHLQIAGGKLQQPERLSWLQAGLFDLRANKDGSRLAMLVDGWTNGLPWRVIATASLENGTWKQSDYVMPAMPSLRIWDLQKTDDGRMLFFTEQRDSLPRREPYEAAFENGSWKKTRIPSEDLAGALCGASSDGMTLLLQDYPERGPVGHFYLFRRTNAGWGKPELVIRNDRMSAYDAVLSPMGNTIVWTRYKRDADVNSITKTELCVTEFRNGSWAPPYSIIEWSHSERPSVAISKSGAIVFSVGRNQGSDVFSRGGGSDVFYRRDLKPGTKEINLSTLLQ